MYVYGNTVAKPDHEPRRQEEPYREPRRRRSSRRSRQVRQNQRRELRVGKRYVIFLSVAAVMALFICVNYVRLQSEITSRSSSPSETSSFLLKQIIAGRFIRSILIRKRSRSWRLGFGFAAANTTRA